MTTSSEKKNRKTKNEKRKKVKRSNKHARLHTGIAFFLSQTGAGRNALRRTLMFTAIWFVVLVVEASVALGLWGGDCSNSYLFMPYAFWLFDGSLKCLLVCVTVMIDARSLNKLIVVLFFFLYSHR